MIKFIVLSVIILGLSSIHSVYGDAEADEIKRITHLVNIFQRYEKAAIKSPDRPIFANVQQIEQDQAKEERSTAANDSEEV